jgi:hypothetical protein
MADWIDNVRAFMQAPETAGTTGALISLKWMPIGSTWRNKAASLACGVSVAFFVMPFIGEVLKLESRAANAMFGYLGGFLGMILLSRLWDYTATTPFGELLTLIFTRKPQQ